MVVGSREKAKELHSGLALQPARKVQRETGVDMARGIRVLRARGIGAHSATDPRGLDALVAEAIGTPDLGESATALEGTARKNAAEGAKRRRGVELEVGGEAKRRRKEAARGSVGFVGAQQGGASADWGFEWREAMFRRLDEAVEGGMRRKHLRKVVLRQYLRHLAQQSEADEARRWWETHPVELKALFQRHLRQAKTDGQLCTRGKMVCRP
uniref:Uncharacterized protein n=1 Tax=Coccolithus braarudii TaxID=221442 RepID=A0A7S0L217_9EUKA|mmetsp:Transcript_15405/g.33432  ORF Transcript_15405/g.33432 Transcript_15405/m.33432 type:complete len:212 (+) Transcript_15405:3-638(+)